MVITAATVTAIRAVTTTAAAGATATTNIPGVVRYGLRRAGALGVALTVWDVWSRLPKRHRRMIINQARIYGPIVITKLMQQQQSRRRRRD
jgi:hypothetical protein